jgi:hypothetical protein
VEWCCTSEAVAFVPGFLPYEIYSRNPGAVAMGSTILLRSSTPSNFKLILKKVPKPKQNTNVSGAFFDKS